MVHDAFPVELLNDPDGQATHALPTGWYPALQEQEEEPAGENEFAPQVIHEELSFIDLYVLALHAEQRAPFG